MTVRNPLSHEFVRLNSDRIMEISQGHIADFTQKINNLSITRAMQAGYEKACRDHGLEVPQFENPERAVGL